MHPVDSVVGALVAGREDRAAVFELSRAARVLTFPGPYAVGVGKRLRGDVSSAVEKVRAILARCTVKTDDLEASHVSGSDTAVCRVHHEAAAGRPLIDVARNDPP